jgi:hypothetical protein
LESFQPVNAMNQYHKHMSDAKWWKILKYKHFYLYILEHLCDAGICKWQTTYECGGWKIHRPMRTSHWAQIVCQQLHTVKHSTPSMRMKSILVSIRSVLILFRGRFLAQRRISM